MFLVGLAILAIIIIYTRPRWYLKAKAKLSKPISYELCDFPEMYDFHNSFNNIQHECYGVLNEPIVELKRELDMWSNGDAKKADDFFKKNSHIRGWIPGPDVENNQWLNFPLVAVGYSFKNNLALCPKLSSLLDKHRERINICGFSLLKPGAKLKPHVDTTGMPYGSLAYHLGLIIPEFGENNLSINNTKFIQQEGQSIIFDSSHTHSAENKSNEDRIILYIDFKV